VGSELRRNLQSNSQFTFTPLYRTWCPPHRFSHLGIATIRIALDGTLIPRAHQSLSSPIQELWVNAREGQHFLNKMRPRTLSEASRWLLFPKLTFLTVTNIYRTAYFALSLVNLVHHGRMENKCEFKRARFWVPLVTKQLGERCEEPTRSRVYNHDIYCLLG
jgi:hypothetical protein